MLNDEEIEALEILNNTEWDGFMITIKNLIEKQSKEIEELKAINQMQKYRIEVIDEREFISKDKIKAKIEELESIEPADDDYNFEVQNDIHSKINILQSLLEKE